MTGSILIHAGFTEPYPDGFPVSGDLIARFMDDPRPEGERRTRRRALGDLLWPRVAYRPRIMCPECRDGKPWNCHGTAWDDATDSETVCSTEPDKRVK